MCCGCVCVFVSDAFDFRDHNRLSVEQGYINPESTIFKYIKFKIYYHHILQRGNDFLRLPHNDFLNCRLSLFLRFVIKHDLLQ